MSVKVGFWGCRRRSGGGGGGGFAEDLKESNESGKIIR